MTSSIKLNEKNYILLFIGPDFYTEKFIEMINIYRNNKSEFKKHNIKAKRMKGPNNKVILYDNNMNIIFSKDLDNDIFEPDMILSNVYKNHKLNKTTINKFKNIINYYGIKSKPKHHKMKFINKIINKINKINITQGVGYFHKKGKLKGLPTKNHCMLISLGYSPFKNKLKNICI